MSNIDALDIKIVQMLGQDALQRNEEIAEKLKVSPATIRRRKKALLDSGKLRVVGVVDPVEFGYLLPVVIAFKVEQGNLESTMEALSQHSEIRWASTTSGRYDIIAIARFQSTNELSKFTKQELYKIAGFKECEIFICMDMMKWNAGMMYPML